MELVRERVPIMDHHRKGEAGNTDMGPLSNSSGLAC
jgi:hypothetical protein